MQRSRISLALTALLLLSCTVIIRAQQKVDMSLVDLAELPNLRSPQLSPDGKQLLYQLSEADWKANRHIQHIWRAGSDGTEAVQLTNGERGESSPRWSPDGHWIAFLARRGEDKKNQIYLIGNAGGEARRLTDHETAVSSIEWAPEGDRIFFLASDPKSKEEKEKDKIKDDVFAFDENFKQRHLWSALTSDGTEQRVTQGDWSMLGYRLSRDGSRIAHHRGPSPLFDDRDESEVWVMDVDGDRAVKMTENGVIERGAEFSPDNSQVLFLADANENFEFYYNDNLFTVPASGGSPRMHLSEMPHEIQGARWSRDGQSIYFTANMGLRTELFRFQPGSGSLDQLTDGQHNLRSWSYLPESETHVFQLSQPENPGDVWSLESGSSQPKRLTTVFEWVSEKYRIPLQERVTWKGADGVDVEGLLFYPFDYEPGKKYGLVVQTHGGPASSDKYGFPGGRNSIPVFVRLGYAVFKPNYRGSTGYGDDFLRDMVGQYFKNAHLDVMTGVDYLIERGIVDPEKMVKMGWSAGGHMTNKIITHTDRFKAASSGAGAVNWISMYAQSDVRIYRTPWFGGTPWQKNAPIEAYWNNSPLKDIWKVRTPTIILVGENDVRVPPPQSVELYRALKSNGVKTHLYIAPREPHGWRELRHQMFKMNVEVSWFEKHAMDREWEWEVPPGEEKGEVKVKDVEAGNGNR